VGKLEAAAKVEMPSSHWNESMKEHARSQAATVKANAEAGVSKGFADPPRVKWNYNASGVLGGMEDTTAAKMFRKLEPGAVIRDAQDAFVDANKELSGVPVGPVYPWKRMKAGADDLKDYVDGPKTAEPFWKDGHGRKGLIPTGPSKGPLPWEY
jgi:hypothetical protein